MTARCIAMQLRVLGSGCALPSAPVSNSQLLDLVRARFGIAPARGAAVARLLGIGTRHVSRPFEAALESPRVGMRNPELASDALAQALSNARLEANTLQYLIGHTATPARPIPPNIMEVASLRGYHGPCMELRQACTGFANGLQIACGLLSVGSGGTSHGAAADTRKNAPLAIVGSEVGSVFFDPQSLCSGDAHNEGQWVNLMQMGDGAGAVVLCAADESNASHPGSGLIESAFYGHLADDESGPRRSGFAMPDGGSDHAGLGHGQSTLAFAHAFERVREHGGDLFRAGLAIVLAQGYTLDDFRFIVPHQVSGRIGALLGKEMNLPSERFFVNADKVGNMGSAAMWVALHQLRESGLLRPGERALFLGAEATQYMYGGFVYTHGSGTHSPQHITPATQTHTPQGLQ